MYKGFIAEAERTEGKRKIPMKFFSEWSGCGKPLRFLTNKESINKMGLAALIPFWVVSDKTLSRPSKDFFYFLSSLKQVSFSQKIKNPVLCTGFCLQRRRDSNPRYLAVQRFSRPPHSTTLPRLCITSKATYCSPTIFFSRRFSRTCQPYL